MTVSMAVINKMIVQLSSLLHPVYYMRGGGCEPARHTARRSHGTAVSFLVFAVSAQREQICFHMNICL